MATIENDVKAGAWRTVFTMWGSGVKVRGVFTRPAGMKIKVRYGFGWSAAIARNKRWTA